MVNKEKAKNTFKTVNMFIAFLLCKRIHKFIKLIVYIGIMVWYTMCVRKST